MNNDNGKISGYGIGDVLDSTTKMDKVVLMRGSLESVSKNFDGMLYFCSRILGVPKEKVTMLMLKQFEMERFHRGQQIIENHSFPVSYYLERIKELEFKLQRRDKEAACSR